MAAVLRADRTFGRGQLERGWLLAPLGGSDVRYAAPPPAGCGTCPLADK